METGILIFEMKRVVKKLFRLPQISLCQMAHHKIRIRPPSSTFSSIPTPITSPQDDNPSIDSNGKNSVVPLFCHPLFSPFYAAFHTISFFKLLYEFQGSFI